MDIVSVSGGSNQALRQKLKTISRKVAKPAKKTIKNFANFAALREIDLKPLQRGY